LLGFRVHDVENWPSELKNLDGVTKAVKKLNMKAPAVEKAVPLSYPVTNLSKHKQVPTDAMWGALCDVFSGKYTNAV
jgi:hypothetical protein